MDKEKISFSEFMNHLPHMHYANVRRNIIAECCITETTFSNWMYCRTNPPLRAKRKIEEIAKNFGFDIQL